MKKHTLKKLLWVLPILILMLTSTLFFSACGGFFRTPTHSFPHIIAEYQREANPIRPIHASDVQTASFARHDGGDAALREQLWEILEMVALQGNRPNLDCPYLLLDVRYSYLNAVAVLDRIILNHFTPQERILAIHDYLVYTVVYDHYLFERYLNPMIDTAEEVAASLSFDIRGVFLMGDNPVAVCEGLSQAFMLMAGIEGLRAVTVLGDFDDGFRRIPHMWNKVAVDGVWYNVDTTLNNFHFSIGGSLFRSSREVSILNHGFFMRSDRSIFSFGRHTEWQQNRQRWYIPAALGEYDFFSNRYFGGIEGLSMVAHNADELVAIFREVSRHNRRVGSVQVALRFASQPTNDLNFFASAIERAYSSVSNSSFTFRAGQSAVPPFAQFPDGVFLFLLYA